MQHTFKRNHPVREINSFKYAFEGLINAIFTEPNFRIQLLIVAFSIVLGKIYKITQMEWSILVLSLGLLLVVELINTVIEEIMDQFMKEYNNGVKIIKDLSAAAVLVTAFTVLANLIIVFFPKIF
ncbi:MAG TPA: diacylglycerol kinase family protein [bacterium]|nr:diacylglycerol kinase family protein [bacterium]